MTAAQKQALMRVMVAWAKSEKSKRERGAVVATLIDAGRVVA